MMKEISGKLFHILGRFLFIKLSGYWRIMIKNPRKKNPRNASAVDLVIQKGRKCSELYYLITMHLSCPSN